MQSAIERIQASLADLGKPSPWDGDLKVSDEFLDPLFARYHQSLGLPAALMRKKQYYELADFVPLAQIAPEVREKLDAIVATAAAAQPAV